MVYNCRRCKHKVEYSSGVYVCDKCTLLVCRLCYLGYAAYCIFCKALLDKCHENLEDSKFRKFFCSLCFKEKYIKNGFYQCSSCRSYSICLNCRSNLIVEKKASLLPRSISVYETQKLSESSEWKEFKEEESFFSNGIDGADSIKKNIESFLLKYPSFKLTKQWQLEETKKDPEGWEYYSEEDKAFYPADNMTDKKFTTRRRKWTISGEKLLDFSECVA